MLKVQCSRIEPRNANLSVVTLSLLEDAMVAELVEVTRDGRIMIQLQDASGLAVGGSYDVAEPPPEPEPDPEAPLTQPAPEPQGPEDEPEDEPEEETVEVSSSSRRKARKRR